MNTFRTNLYTAISCIMGAAALCTGVSTSVQAEDLPTKTVRFDDLNITETAGAKILYNRIRAAARKVCDVSIDGDPILRLAAQQCFDKAVDQAVRDVNAPALSALRFGSANVRLASK